jgi:hypothetical protein
MKFFSSWKDRRDIYEKKAIDTKENCSVREKKEREKKREEQRIEKPIIRSYSIQIDEGTQDLKGREQTKKVLRRKLHPPLDFPS